MTKYHLVAISLLFCLFTKAQTADSTLRKRIKPFVTVGLLGFNTVHTLRHEESNDKITSKNPLKGTLMLLTGGVFFTKHWFCEGAATLLFKHKLIYTSDGNWGTPQYENMRTINTSGIYSANGGYKVYLGKKQSGYAYIKFGASVAQTIINDTTNTYYSHGLNNAASHTYTTYNGGLAYGFNNAIGLGFKIGRFVSMNFSVQYHYLIYRPQFSAYHYDATSYIIEAGQSYYYNTEQNLNTKYNATNAPKIPLNILSVNWGLGFNF